MTVDKYRKRSPKTITKDRSSIVRRPPHLGNCKNVDNTSALMRVVDAPSQNGRFQLKKFFEILRFDESIRGVLNSYILFSFNEKLLSDTL